MAVALDEIGEACEKELFLLLRKTISNRHGLGCCSPFIESKAQDVKLVMEHPVHSSFLDLLLAWVKEKKVHVALHDKLQVEEEIGSILACVNIMRVFGLGIPVEEQPFLSTHGLDKQHADALAFAVKSIEVDLLSRVEEYFECAVGERDETSEELGCQTVILAILAFREFLPILEGSQESTEGGLGESKHEPFLDFLNGHVLAESTEDHLEQTSARMAGLGNQGPDCYFLG